MSIPVDKDEKKRQILLAAIRVFARKGAVGTKIQDIADEAGVAKGTIYLYFRNKQEILKSIIHSSKETDPAMLQQLLASDIDHREKIKKIISGLLDSTCRGDFPIEIMPEIWAAVLRGKEKKSLEDEILHFKEILTQLFSAADTEKRIDAENSALSMVALLHGLIVLHAVNNKSFDVHAIADKFIDDLLGC